MTLNVPALDRAVPRQPNRAAALVDRLTAEHSPAASREDVTACVNAAWRAVRMFGATDDAEMLDLAERVAERDLRLRLGLEREIARLDPEDHHR